MPISAPAALIGIEIALLVGGACAKWTGSARRHSISAPPAALEGGVILACCDCR
jgi:hypothetical protein